MGITAAGYADVPDGTQGELQVSGPLSWTCPRKFVNHTREFPYPYMNLPWFKVGDSKSFQFYGPPGRYTLTLVIPLLRGTVSGTVSGGGSRQDPALSTAGCIPSA